MEPILKWPGGKRWMRSQVAERLGLISGTYYEPFLGGGAVFFSIRPRLAVLSDLNSNLIDCYKWIRDDIDGVWEHLQKFSTDEDSFYRIRSAAFSGGPQGAAEVLYLTQYSYNGLFRLNQSGKFNVPYGFRPNQAPFCQTTLRMASALLKNVKLLSCDFAALCDRGKDGDAFYLDPPYTSAGGCSTFKRYTSKLFTWDDQVRLAMAASRLREKGCKVVVSNVANEEIEQLYAGFHQMKLLRKSSMAPSASHRSTYAEALYYS